MYRFVYVATNVYGDSEPSLHLIAGLGQPPTLSSAPVRDSAYDLFDKYNLTVQMMISWDGIAVVNELSVLGFALSMDDGLDNDDKFTIVYDSGNNPLGL